MFIIKEGLSATDAAADDTVTRTEMAASGVSDASGLYRTDVAVPRGRTYSVIIIARGYRSIVADGGIEVPSDATIRIKSMRRCGRASTFTPNSSRVSYRRDRKAQINNGLNHDR